MSEIKGKRIKEITDVRVRNQGKKNKGDNGRACPKSREKNKGDNGRACPKSREKE